MPTLQAGNDDAQRAASELQTDPIGLSVDGMVQGKANAVGGTVHTQVVASQCNPVIISAIEYVTQDGTSAPSSSLRRTTACGGAQRRTRAGRSRSRTPRRRRACW
eukprot:7185504-Prymnesium_polylepis.1